MRGGVVTVVLAAAVLIGADLAIVLLRTEAMAPVGWSRLFFALLFQAVGVLGITAMRLPKQAPLRRFLEDTHRALPVVMAAGGVAFGIALAIGALHYSNCERWDFHRGVMCRG